ncbi:unnamed protein product [Victoria cruziana]
MDGGGEPGGIRCWEELLPDALGLIFRKLPLQETLTVVPRVCKSWGKVVAGPYCWQEIDIEEWCMHCKPDQMHRMLQLLLGRSSGSLRKLAVYAVPDDAIFSFIADHGASLESLRVPKSRLSDAIFDQVADKFQKLTSLDVSYCENIGARALEAIGRHCKSLVSLKRAMHPLGVLDRSCQDDEAMAIAKSMPQLKHLEMAYVLLTTSGVRTIITACRELEFLDVRGCWDVKLEGEEWLVKRQQEKGLKVLGPEVVDRYDFHYLESCSDDEDDEWGSIGDEDYHLDWDLDDADIMLDNYDGSSDDMWDEDQDLEGLELRLYVASDDSDHGIGWGPGSP